MPPVVIPNPVINSPFAAPQRHFRFDDEGITDQIVDGRRGSSFFIPIARPRKRDGQMALETEWTRDRIQPNAFVDRIRAQVARWRSLGRPGTTATTARLLAHWTDPERERRLFFCQIEALETAIYLAECARRSNDAWIENDLRVHNELANDGLPRIAFKMATGAGKTVVMAMLIAWQALNKIADRHASAFSDTFLVVTPGITIRDRLRVLLPNDPQNYYRERNLVPAELVEQLQRARILITNFHGFKLREHGDAARLTKALLAGGGSAVPSGRNPAFVETSDQMVRRVCRELGSKRNIVVLNDEAHHCYRHKADDHDGDDEPSEKLDRDERAEANRREENARLWSSGLESVKRKIGLKAVYDLSATPFFLRGSGYPEGTLFPWVVSDFSLIDAIESGIVKVPRVPVADDAMTGAGPTYRDLWLRIREELPRKGRKTDALSGEPRLPPELQGALHSLYENYRKFHALWDSNAEAQARGLTPPVFIVVCNNTSVSKLVFDYVAGWEKPIAAPDGSPTTVVQAGALELFRNDDGRGGWSSRPTTILVDSEQLESGDAMSAEFKKTVSAEIDEFKSEYRARFPGRDADALTDEDLLREVMNTVGKAGKLGEHVKCVVSVSMLTEGWDANTVTHVLGVRAFGTQLLCEQVVGRALRRMSYAPSTQRVDVGGMAIEFLGFPAEYAEVYGVPFSFIPTAGAMKDPRPGPMPTRVRALESRAGCEMTFPRLAGYRFDLADDRLSHRFDAGSERILDTRDVPTQTEMLPIVGEGSVHGLDDLRSRRLGEVAFRIAKLTLERHFHDAEGNAKPWLFPQVLGITRAWLAECVRCKDNAFPQLLLFQVPAHDAADRIYRSIVAASAAASGAGGRAAAPPLRPILRPHDTLGSTLHVGFDTTRNTYRTRPDRCHVSHVVADTDSWEQKLAQTLEAMPEVLRYVKNHGLDFTIPYTIDGQERRYLPDFLVDVDDGHGPGDPLHLIVEVSGEPKKDKQAKVASAKTLWVPAVNNHGGFGRWGFVEVTDPWDAQRTLRSELQRLSKPLASDPLRSVH